MTEPKDNDLIHNNPDNPEPVMVVTEQTSVKETGTNHPIHENKSLKAKLIFLILFVIVVIIGLWLANRPAPIQIQGMVDAESINVSTKVASRVEQLLVKEGQHVQQGQLLGNLVSPEVQAKQQQAAGALQSAQALLQTAERGSQAENIASLKASWQSASAQANLARVTLQRSENLFKEGVISRQRLDESRAASQSATQTAEAAHQQYLRAERGSTPEQLSSATAQVTMAKAAVMEANALEAETKLIAPHSGEVNKQFANVGELVAAGVPIYTLIDLEDAWVTINIKEDQFNNLKIGQILHGDIPALNLKAQAFTVTHIAAEGTFASWKPTRQSNGYDIRTFEVKLKPAKHMEDLRPGMSVLFNWPQNTHL